MSPLPKNHNITHAYLESESDITQNIGQIGKLSARLTTSRRCATFSRTGAESVFAAHSSYDVMLYVPPEIDINLTPFWATYASLQITTGPQESALLEETYLVSAPEPFWNPDTKPLRTTAESI